MVSSTRGDANLSKKNKGVMNVKRGPTRMKKIARARNDKKVFPVQWNHRGQPVGKNSVTMSSYIGAKARSTVPIKFKDWPDVPKSRKNSIWEDVKLTFNLADDKEDFVLSQAGTMWRNFKSYLTREWIFKNGKINKEPPPNYSYIDLDHWREFVASRLTYEFQAKSETNRLAGGKNKYIQKRSRKGCARLEHEELEKMGDDATSIPRAVMWKLMRTSATSGDISPEAQEVADKIDELTECSRQGEFEDSGRNDVLARALGKEHGGRVRGVGAGANITNYFGSLANPKQTRDEVKELKLMVNQLTREVAEMKNKQCDGGKSSITTHEDIELDPNTNANHIVHIPEGHTTCKLALLDPTYRIVAVGKVHNVPEEDLCALLGRPLLPNEVRVSIDYVLEDEAPLPIPMDDEASIIGEAVGIHVAWPRHLVVVEEKMSTKLKDKGIPNVSSSNGKTKSKLCNKEKENVAPLQVQTAPTMAAMSASKETRKMGDTYTIPKEVSTIQDNARCKLVLKDPAYRVVAIGKVHKSTILHGKQLLPDEVRVSIDNVLEGGAFLPIPLKGEAYTVGEALGTHVAWPKHLIVIEEKAMRASKGKTRKGDTSQIAEEVSTLQNNARCKLVLKDHEYRVVAVGNVHKSTMLHGKPLLPGEVRVSIDSVLKDGAFLPIPLADEAYTVGEALGTHVAWPKHLIVVIAGKTIAPNQKDKGEVCASLSTKQLGTTMTVPPSKPSNNIKTSELYLHPQKAPTILV